MNRRVSLQDINPLLICVLCGGYYVDATTIIECVHSFCRSCIVKHLETSKYCPICEVMVHKTKPLTNIRRDKTLQDIVYKLVPGLFAREMRNRQQFYKERPHYVKPEDSIECGEEFHNSYMFEDSINLALTDHSAGKPVWFLKCPIGVTIQHLKKLILAKFGFKEKKVCVQVLLKNNFLDNELTLLEISCIHPWRNNDPIELSYEMLGIDEPANLEKIKILETEKPIEIVEKEIQLQITESGVMCVSEVDSRESNDSFNQIIASSLPTVVLEPSKVETPSRFTILKKVEDKVKERSKRLALDGAVSKPKRPAIQKEPENKKEKQILSHSVHNMVANSVKEQKVDDLPKVSPKPQTNNNDRPKVPDIPVTRKLDVPVVKLSMPPILPYAPELRTDKPRPVGVTPPAWRTAIPKQKLRPTLLATNEPRKPAKHFKMRNMPRFLGNPASGVKPLYSNGLSESPPTSPTKKPDPIVRIDPKTLRPVDKEEKKAPNTLLTNPFIPRDKHLLLPDPKTQPYSNVAFPPGFHASLPPTISHLMSSKPYRSVKIKGDSNSCDSNESRPSASCSKPENETSSASTEKS